MGSLALLLEARVGSLLPDLKGLAEARAEEMLGNRIMLSIGSIDGGILHPIVFSDIKIKDRGNALMATSLVIDSIKTDYRLWDLVLNKKTGRDLLKSKVKGYVLLFDKERIEFSGDVRQDSFDLDIWLPKGTVRVEGNISRDGALLVRLKASHVQLYDFDITCDVNLINTQKLEGELETKSLTLNHMPFPDFKASYKISDSRLEVPRLDFGDGVAASGEILLKKPYDMRIVLTANNVNLGWFLFRLGFKEATSAVSGTMNGKFELSGAVDALRLNSYFEIRSGTMLKVDFDNLSANINGEMPFVRIEDSRITTPGGYFVLAGEMDLRRIGKNNLFDDVRIVTEYRDKVPFEYKLQPNDSLKMMVGEGEEFLGLEHKDRF